jgi:hypothetical protein
MDYREADEAYFEIVDKDGDCVFGAFEGTAFPNTYRAMFGFCAKTNSLKTALFDAIDSNNPYAFKALFRCFCEHYLKFLYIWTRFLTEKDDAAGTDYYMYCGATEAKEYAAAIAAAENLMGNQVAADMERVIAEMYPATAAMSSRELERASGQFKYRAILRYLAGDGVRFVHPERPFLAHIVPSYALMSSFVHGGPYSDMEMADFSSPKALEECSAKAEVAFLMCASVFMLTAVAVSRERAECREVAAKVRAVLRDFLEAVA